MNHLVYVITARHPFCHGTEREREAMGERQLCPEGGAQRGDVELQLIVLCRF